MFIKVADLPTTRQCAIVGYGHTEMGDDPRFQEVTQEQFIDMLSYDARSQLFGSPPPWSDADKAAVAESWISATGIRSRVFFAGTTAELAVIAARKCLAQAGVSASELDAIVAGSNTGPGYPSLADYIKLGLGQRSQAMAYDVQEACPVGCIAVFNGWNLVKSGAAKYALVVCAEKATELAELDDWKSSNLFGAAASAYLLKASDREAFRFWGIRSEPFDGQIEMIMKTARGFTQNGKGVHRFVGRDVVLTLAGDVAKAGINPADIKHLVPHQPSAKTLNRLVEKLQDIWQVSSLVVHRNVEEAGNTSGASTGWLISRAVLTGQIKPGELVVVTTFGAGLSIGNYGFIV